jgi:D-amino-acid dehydrogenase
MLHKTETLIIGGGAIGVCCAYYLSQSGKKVTLVEMGEICSGSSYGNAGLIVPSHSIPLAAQGVISRGIRWMFNPESPFYIRPRLSRGLVSWLWRFQRACSARHVRRATPLLRDLIFASRRLFDELRTEVDFYYEKKGMLEAFNTDKTFKKSIEESGFLREYGVESRILGRDEVREALGGVKSNAMGGIFFPQDCHIDPAQFVNRLAAQIEKEGTSLLTSTEVLGAETRDRRVATIKTTKGDIAFEDMVLAGGARSDKIVRELGLRLLMEPAKGYSVTFKRPEICPSIPVAMAEKRVLLTPMNKTLRLAGTLELAGFDFSINMRRVQAILKSLPEYFPDMDSDSFELMEIWRGLRPCTPDGLPYLGRSRKYDNLIVAAGHGTMGISLAPVTGKIVSQLATGAEPAIDLTAMEADRFA